MSGEASAIGAGEPAAEGGPLPPRSAALQELEQQLLHELHEGSRRLVQEQEDLVKRLFERLHGCGGPHPGDSEPSGTFLFTADQVCRASDPSRRASDPSVKEERSTSVMERQTAVMRRSLSQNYIQSTGITSRTRQYAELTTEMDLFFHVDYPFLSRFENLYCWWRSIRREPKRTGCLADLVTSFKFELLVLLMILVNAVFLIFDSNKNASIALGWEVSNDLPKPFQSWDWWRMVIFTAFFTAEMVLKLFHHRLYFFVNDDMWWNMFDLTTTTIGFIEVATKIAHPAEDGLNVGFLRVIRIFRMTRSLRVVRALKIVRSLRVLLNCIIGSIAGLFWCIVLLLFVNIVCATILVQFSTTYWTEAAHLHELDPESEKAVMHKEFADAFGSVSNAMLSLLMATTGGSDWGDTYSMLKPTGFMGQSIFLAYIIFSILAAWNLATTMFIEKALELAKPDEEEQKVIKRRQEEADIQEMHKLVTGSDLNMTGKISLVEFEMWMADQRTQDFCRVKNIDIKDAQLFYNMLTAIHATEEVEIDVIVGGLMQMRGHATGFDMRAMSLLLLEYSRESEKMYEAIFEELRRMNGDAQHLQQRTCAGPNNAPNVSRLRGRSSLESVRSDIASLDLGSMQLERLGNLLGLGQGNDPTARCEVPTGFAELGPHERAVAA